MRDGRNYNGNGCGMGDGRNKVCVTLWFISCWISKMGKEYCIPQADGVA